MGARGALPQPDNVRQLRGNPGKRKPRPTVKAKPGAPRPPARIRGEALAEWKRVVAELNPTGRLAKLDRALLTVYCRTWQRWCELDTLISSSYVVKGIRNSDRKHPAWQMLREVSRDLAALAKELGLSPNGRLRMTGEEDAADDEDDPFD